MCFATPLRFRFPFALCLMVPDFPGTRLLRLALNPFRGSHSPSPSLLRRTCPGAGIYACFPSAAPFGLALGPDLPRADEPSPGILGLSVCRILTCISLLTPAFSLPCCPYPFSVILLPACNAPLPHTLSNTSAASVSGLAPVHFRRRATRLVSCYALFKGWLLLSQPPSCPCVPTSFST